MRGFAQRLILGIVVLTMTIRCDSSGNQADEYLSSMICNSYAICSEYRSVQFGLIGDSWAVMMSGTSVVYTLRSFLEIQYGFQIIGASQGGRRLESVVDQGLHLHLIDQVGPNIRYMLIILGGNDVLFGLDPVNLDNDAEAEWARVLSGVQSNLLTLVRSGNAYKISRYGGSEIEWYVLGYDYLNPENSFEYGDYTSTLGCNVLWSELGFDDDVIEEELPTFIDRFNETIIEAAGQEPFIRHIDLRGTMGGPPVSDKSLMLDCVHPNSVGFGLLTARYVKLLDYHTDHAR